MILFCIVLIQYTDKAESDVNNMVECKAAFVFFPVNLQPVKHTQFGKCAPAYQDDGLLHASVHLKVGRVKYIEEMKLRE